MTAREEAVHRSKIFFSPVAFYEVLPIAPHEEPACATPFWLILCLMESMVHQNIVRLQ